MGNDEDSYYSVFDGKDEDGVVPLTAFIHGKKQVIGKAYETENGIAMEFDENTPEDLRKAIMGSGPTFAISEGWNEKVDPPVNKRPDNVQEHIHKPVQHRDGKPPWCHTCGLTIGYLIPESRIHRR